MRIGILTFHCAYNYGAVLQCYALQEYLKSRGHSVYVIDYRPKAITSVYDWFVKRRIIRKNFVKSIVEICLLWSRKKRNSGFQNFITSRLNLASIDSIMDNPYDLILVGADQVWNYHLTDGFDDYYWGNFRHPATTKIATYGASMHDKWSQEESLHILESQKNFHMISVRESSLAEKLKSLTGRKDIYRVVDPTLLLSGNAWRSLAEKPYIKHPYLLLFQVEGKNRKTEAIAKEMARRKNLKVIHLFTLADWGTTSSVMSTSPMQFLGLFLYADFVVCSSFHGTIFSLLFRKSFLSVKMGIGKDNRVASLLESMGLSDHFVDTLPKEYDGSYQLDDMQLDSLRQDSTQYIIKLEKMIKC